MAIAHIKGMTKFALVLRGPKRTAVVAARFPPFPPSLLRSPPSLLLPTPSTLLPTPSTLLPTPSTLPAVFAVTTSCLKPLCLTQILVTAIVFSILLAVQGMKLLLRTTAVIDLDLMQMATAHSKSTDGMAILADKFHWTVSDEPIGNGNATTFWYKPVIQFGFGVIEYTHPRASSSVVYIQ